MLLIVCTFVVEFEHLFVNSHTQILSCVLCVVCAERVAGEEEPVPVCDLLGAHSQADQQCCVRDMC